MLAGTARSFHGIPRILRGHLRLITVPRYADDFRKNQNAQSIRTADDWLSDYGNSGEKRITITEPRQNRKEERAGLLYYPTAVYPRVYCLLRISMAGKTLGQ